MVQFRRLDPLAKAGPYQRLVKYAVKSVSLAEEQFDRVSQARPQLIISEDDCMVVGFPHRDFLQLHYGFPDIEHFRRNFTQLVTRLCAASSKAEAPRGLLLPFRDRPNRFLAEDYFWELGMQEGQQWVEMSLIAVPEQPEPEPAIAGGFHVREAGDGDREVLAEIEAEVTGLPKLSGAGIDSLYADARWLRLVTAEDGTAVGFLSLRREPAGWGIVDICAVRPAVRDQLREPLLRWSIAWLRNNGGRRIRQRVLVDDSAQIALLRSAGFTAGETGIDYMRPIEAAEVQRRVEARKGTGTLIKFGDWR